MSDFFYIGLKSWRWHIMTVVQLPRINSDNIAMSPFYILKFFKLFKSSECTAFLLWAAVWSRLPIALASILHPWSCRRKDFLKEPLGTDFFLFLLESFEFVLLLMYLLVSKSVGTRAVVDFKCIYLLSSTSWKFLIHWKRINLVKKFFYFSFYSGTSGCLKPC